MIWNEHLELAGRHSIFAPSNPSWMNYSLDDSDEDVIFQRFCSQYASQIGTIAHEFAEKRIKYNQKLLKANKSDLLCDLLDAGIPSIVINMDYIYPNVMNYTNDAIGYRMDSEVKLKYSETFFGTTDTISFRDKELRIHDLKTGKGLVHLDQLLAYSALFFLEYGKAYDADPKNTKVILRIYQAGDIVEDIPEADRVIFAMHQIVEIDKKCAKWKVEGIRK